MMYIIGMCEDLKVVWTLFGYVIWAIKVVVPLLLIISGMITMAKAVMEKKRMILKSSESFNKKVIAAVIVYLVITVTKVVIGLVATGDWETCVECAFNPFSGNCGFDKTDIPSGM